MSEARLVIRATDATIAAFASVNRNLAAMRTEASKLSTVLNVAIGFMAVRGVKTLIDWGDSIGDASKKLGISTGALQEMGYAAKQMGVDNEKLTSGMEKFSVQMGNLRAGTGKLDEGLAKLDPGLVALLKNTKDNEEAFSVAIKRIDEYRSEQDRAALSAVAFGKASADMHLIVRDGIGKFSELRAEARRVGAVLSDDTIKRADDTKDAFAKFGTVLKVNVLEALSGTLPKLKEVAESLSDPSTQGNMRSFFEALASGTGILLNAAKAVGALYKEATALKDIFWFEVYAEAAKNLNSLTLAYRAFDAMPDDIILKKLTLPGLKKEIIETEQHIQKILGMVSEARRPVTVSSMFPEGLPKQNVKIDTDQEDRTEKERADARRKRFLTDLETQKQDLMQYKEWKDALEKASETPSQRLVTEMSERRGALSELRAAEFISEEEHKKLLQGLEQQHRVKLTEIVGSPVDKLKLEHAQRLEAVRLLQEQEFISVSEAKLHREAIEEEHQRKLTEMAASGAIARRDFESLSAKQQADFVIGAVLRATTEGAKHSRAMFNINKVANIANAIMNTGVGYTRALSATPWPPLNLAMAGLIFTSGMLQVRNIASQNFSGGGSSGGGSGGGGIPPGIGSPSEIGAPAETAKATETPTAIINIGDDVIMGGTGFRNLIEKINEQYPNGVKIKVS